MLALVLLLGASTSHAQSNFIYKAPTPSDWAALAKVVDVNEGGKVVAWGVEGMSPNYLARRGWTKNTFKPGDRVTLTIRPMRDGSPGGMSVRGILADGKPVTFAATEQ